jgi:hypothetical protein
MLFLLIVVVNALPGERPPDVLAPGEEDNPGVEDSAEGGGEEPSKEDRSPPPLGEARMVLVVGTAGDPGTARLAEPPLGDMG